MTKNEKHREFESLKIMQECPKFDRCSAPYCPLDLLQDIRDRFPGEPKCRLSKNKRMKIAEGTGLPLTGLTKMEHAAEMRWNRLDRVEKERRIAGIKNFNSNYTGN